MKEFNFESAIEKLENITKELESGKLGLDESVKLYTEGVRLCADCSSALEKAEIRIKELTSQGDVK